MKAAGPLDVLKPGTGHSWVSEQEILLLGETAAQKNISSLYTGSSSSFAHLILQQQSPWPPSTTRSPWTASGGGAWPLWLAEVVWSTESFTETLTQGKNRTNLRWLECLSHKWSHSDKSYGGKPYLSPLAKWRHTKNRNKQLNITYQNMSF